MSNNMIARPYCRRTSAHHFYAVVAVSCCAFLPMTEYTVAEETAAPETKQQEQAPQTPAEAPAGQSEEQSAEKKAEVAADSSEEVSTESEDVATAEEDDVAIQEDLAQDENDEPVVAQESVRTSSADDEKPADTKAAPGNESKDTSEALEDNQYAREDSAVNFATAGKSLREQAARYRKLTDQWQPIAPGAPLHSGDQGPRVAQLRKVLQLFGDYSGQPGPVITTGDNLSRHANRFDAGLVLAVESYQRRHGMVVTGVADKATLKLLARPPEELARLLELNAERWDKLPNQPGKRYILVNVPDYQLQLVDQQRVILSMKTVVGKSSKRTPDMTTKLVSVVFNPTWTVPRSILLTDLLPKARNNPEAMHKRGYRVVKYGTNTTTPISDESIQSAASGKATLRQISGPGNTLGRVKFVIPNKQAIFLHDTQAQSLFEHQLRAFSHGCIRLQQPEELAYALLGPQGWDRTRVAQATTGDESVTIKVDNPPKLFIAYLTAWVDGLGKVHFRPDVYHRDN